MADPPLSRIASALASAQEALRRARHPLALVGGLAVSVRAEPRFTRDIDLAVAVGSDSDAEKLILDLSAAGFYPKATVEHEALHRLSTVRLLAPIEHEHGIVVDLLFASSGIEQEITAEAELLEVFEGLTAPVARTGHLIALKILSRNDTRRPQDIADLRGLLAVADATEIDRARRAVALISARGFDRGRPLASQMEALVSEVND